MNSKTRNTNESAKEAKYIAILDAAEAVVVREGLSGLSINKVARQANIAKGTVYIYFDSKEEIIGGLTIRARKVLLEYFHKYCNAEKDPLDKVKAIFWADYHFYKEQPTYHQLVSFYEQNTGLIETKELGMSSYQISGFVESVIDNAKKHGAIRSDIESGLQAFVFWGMVTGILQIIDTKGAHLQKYFGKSETEFYSFFVENSIKSIVS